MIKKNFENTKKIKLTGNKKPEYILRLFVTGATPHSMSAVKNINIICEQYLKDRYQLDTIDVYQQPDLAQGENIIATPTLIIIKPEPRQKLIGDLSDTAKVLLKLGII